MRKSWGEGELFTGRGSQSIDSAGETIPVVSTYDNGEWRVIFKRPRQTEDGFSFEEGSFAPVAFSIWDGYSGERGNKRGVTAWYHIYMEPVKEESKAIPIAGYGLLTLLIEAGVIMTVRRKNGRTAS